MARRRKDCTTWRDKPLPFEILQDTSSARDKMFLGLTFMTLTFDVIPRAAAAVTPFACLIHISIRTSVLCELSIKRNINGYFLSFMVCVTFFHIPGSYTTLVPSRQSICHIVMLKILPPRIVNKEEHQ